MDDTPLTDHPGAVDASAVLDALPRAIIVTDPEGRILVWNRQAQKLYGWKAAEVTGRLVTEVLVPVPDRGQALAILDVVRGGAVWEGDFSVLRKNGESVRVWVSERPLVDGAGALVAIVGASEDIAARRLLEQQAADLTEHLRLALEAGGLGTFRWDMASGATDWDEQLEAMFGLEPGGFDGTFDMYVALLHPDDREGVLRTVYEAVQSKSRYTVQHRVLWPDGSVHWLHGAGQATVDESGSVTGAIGCTREVTEQVVAEQERDLLMRKTLEAAEQERLNRERLEFLGSINDALTSAHDRHELMANVTRAAVPRLGDWCVIYVLPHRLARVPEIEVAHVVPAMVDYARQLQERFPYEPNAVGGMPHVIRDGVIEFYPVIDEAVISNLDASDGAREVVRDLALTSSMAVPLIKRGRVLGGLQFVMSNSRRHYTSDDLTLAQVVASRIAASLDNLRLSEEQRSIASTLQASLLPDELPVIPGFEVAVRYWATGEAIDVGGDFYDLFRVSNDRWAVVMGDVCGTGPGAAALTAMARHTIASGAWHGDDHVGVLENLNRAMQQRRTGSYCTALYATVDAGDASSKFTVAAGGHPLPIIARADGSVAPFGKPGTLIGVFDDIAVTVAETEINPGDTVVFYTDGVTDVAPPHTLSTDDFAQLVGRSAIASSSAEGLADQLHTEISSIMPIEQRDDDIALLILRRL